MSIFSYQVKPDGGLKGIDDARPIRMAQQASVGPLMVITNIVDGAGFSSELANAILTNRRVQDILLENIIGVLQGNDYYGLDIDFE